MVVASIKGREISQTAEIGLMLVPSPLDKYTKVHARKNPKKVAPLSPKNIFNLLPNKPKLNSKKINKIIESTKIHVAS